MPPCHVRNVKLVAEADHGILPFLAPRVFQPWPFPRSQQSGKSKSISIAAGDRKRRSAGPGGAAASREGLYGSSQAPTLRVRCQERCYQSNALKESPSNAQDEWESLWSSWGLTTSKNHKPKAAVLDRYAGAPDQDEGADVDTLTPTKENDGALTREQQKARQRRTARRRQLRSWAMHKARYTAFKDRPESGTHEWTRNKWVRVGHPVRLRNTDELGYAIWERPLFWNQEFAKLQAQYDKSIHRHRIYNQHKTDQEAAVWARELLDTPEGEGPQWPGAFAVYYGLSWQEIWTKTMLYVLRERPADAPRFLTRTHVRPFAPQSCVADALLLLFYRQRASGDRSPAALDELVNLVCTLAERPDSPPLDLSGPVVRILQRQCDKNQSLRLFEAIRQHRVKVHSNTLLHFSTMLARHNDFDRALDVLLEASNGGADCHASQFESACATVLRAAAIEPEGLRVSLRIVQNLADIGVKINVQLCNIVMLNAVESGDLKTAFSVYHSLVEHGLKADHYTYAILIKGCKAVVEDSETLNATIRLALKDTNIAEAHVLATEILHCLYLHHFHHNPDTAYSIIAEAYSQLFDPGPLIRISLLPASYQNPSSPRRPPPTDSAVGIMLAAFLRDKSSRHSSHISAQQHALYHDYRRLVALAVQPWSRMATSSDHVANTFLMAFTAHRSTLPHAAEVVRDMQQPPASPGPTVTDTQRPSIPSTPQATPPHHPPTTRTYSIFLHGFARHALPHLAEQVLAYMRARNVQPNQVTWNALVQGYSRARDAEGALDAFRRMRADGWPGNEVTGRVMGRLGGGIDVGGKGEGEGAGGGGGGGVMARCVAVGKDRLVGGMADEPPEEKNAYGGLDTDGEEGLEAGRTEERAEDRESEYDFWDTEDREQEQENEKEEGARDVARATDRDGDDTV